MNGNYIQIHVILYRPSITDLNFVILCTSIISILRLKWKNDT